MTTVLVIATVLLGAEGGTPAAGLDLKQPSIAATAHPVVVDYGLSPVSHEDQDNDRGLIKPVGFDPARAENFAPVIRASAYSGSEHVSLLQDSSPSDTVVAPPIPEVPSAKPIKMAPSSPPMKSLGESYSVDDDYTIRPSCDSTCDDGRCSTAHGCQLCSEDTCGCGSGHGHGGFYARHCLPSPWHAPGNMVPHIPYDAVPKTYYYFRPYQMFMIPDQQAQAASWVKNRSLPYSNQVFDKVYAELEDELNPSGEFVRPATRLVP
ncbi:hypothetical protein [Blastopirellula marina]|uniref:Uncharacterized protein n=1 Tax=Blastopirellula marina TaxID=124 RepID=A0A2S8GDI1_9BACT|nr:hypothetical protein [Blastopirellula marina]PQO42144.1 hypothetical protein C5Y93_27750 [Blastopirellula marina]